ncbi:MAG: DUF4166 domain-containing protein [Ardenticatenales bacterium]
MTSIFQRVLGADFNRLHPRIQERFALTSASGRAAIGRGTMERVWHGRFYTLPFLYVGTWRNILFPERGADVPFEIENWAYRDTLGRETVTWLRTFHTDRRRRFDAYMIYSDARGRIVDYLGTHQHLAVDLALSVDDRGGLRLRSGEQRFYEGPIAFRFPLFFSGVADVCEWFDDETDRYQIEVVVTNRFWGPLFGYRGSFDVDWVDVVDGPSAAVRPRREERRE